MPKYVASRTLKELTWRNSTLIGGDVGESVRRLKREPGNEIQVHGSSDLIQTLLQQDLVDEMRLWVFPMVLGTGKRLFGSGAIPGAFRLVDSIASSTGVSITRYEAAGAIRYGSFEVDERGGVEALWRESGNSG
jgi:dihydrofolate reductase